MNPDDQPGDGDGDGGDRAAVAARLHAALTGPSLDPAVRARHLQAIRDRAAALPTPTPAPAPAVTPARSHVTAARGLGRRLASSVSAAGLVVVLGASGAVAASHSSLPGDTLYPLKAATEQLVLAAPLPPSRTVERHVTFAERRLDEAADLAAREEAPALVAEAIAAHTRLMARAGELAEGDTELAGRVDAATVVAQRRLAALLEQDLPDLAADQAREALSAADARLDSRPAPGSPAIPSPDGRPDTTPAPRPGAPTPPTPRPGPAPGAPAPAPDRFAPGTPAPGTPAPRTPTPDTPAPGAPAPRDPGQPSERAPQAPAPTSPARPTPAPAPVPRQSAQAGGDTAHGAPAAPLGPQAESSPPAGQAPAAPAR